MEKDNKYKWFAQPLDEFTNRRICEHFNTGQNIDCIINGVEVVLPENKKDKVDLIQLSLDQKNILIKTYFRNPDYKFKLFVKKGKGQIRFVSKTWVAGKPVFAEIDKGVSFDKV